MGSLSAPRTASITILGAPGECSRHQAYCNASSRVVQAAPAPSTLEGQGLSAACYALGGKIDLARGVIDRLAAADRYQAAGSCSTWRIPWPTPATIAQRADHGAGRRLLANHYMALYHAGMSSTLWSTGAAGALTAFSQLQSE